MDALLAAAAAAAPSDDPAPPPIKRLTELQRWSIIALHNDGRSFRYIAEKLDVHRDTVRAVWSRYLATDAPGSGARSGRPRCTDLLTDLAVQGTARELPFTSPRQVRRKLVLEASPRTLDRRMQEAGLFGRVAQHKRDYSPAEMRARLSFAEGYGDWTEAQWERVIFSDEKMFYGSGFCGRTWVRRPVGEAFNPQYTVHKTAHPIKVGVWACFSAAGRGYIYITNENIDGDKAAKILRENVLPSAELLKLTGQQYFWLHDNVACWNTEACRTALFNAGVTPMQFPAYSPDLNPIENLWAIWARAVEKRPATTLEELQDIVQEEYEKIDAEVFKKLSHSMVKRCKAVVEAGGWHTSY